MTFATANDRQDPLFTMSDNTSSSQRERRRIRFSWTAVAERAFSTVAVRLVEPVGIEPTTSCLQSTRSPS
jgi:hypothetical protein